MPSDSMDVDEKLPGGASQESEGARPTLSHGSLDAGAQPEQATPALGPQATPALGPQATPALGPVEAVDDAGHPAPGDDAGHPAPGQDGLQPEALGPAIAELEDIEALDDIEELDELDEPADAGPLPPRLPAIPPRLPTAPPRLPTAPPRPATRPPAAPGAVARERSAPVMAAAEPSRPVPAPVLPEGPEPPAITMASPTVVEEALAALGDATWTARADRLARRLETSADPDAIAAAAHELGELAERRLHDQARAVKAYDQALKTDPSLRANLWAIRRVFHRRGLWPNLIKLLDVEIDYAQSDEERADLYVEKGHILEDQLGDAEKARAAYESALDLVAPGSPSRAAAPALIALERLALSAGDEAALEALWPRLCEHVSAPALKLVYLLDLARLQADRGDVEQALDTLSDAVALGVDRDRVARERLRVAELAGDPDGVLSAIEARIAHLGEGRAQGAAAGDDDESERARRLEVALRRRQAREARRMAADELDASEALLERAWRYLEQAATLAPDEPLVLGDQLEVAGALGRHAEVADLCERWHAIEPDPARALHLLLRRADALLQSGAREQAHAVLAALTAEAPGFVAVTALWERDALASGDHAALAAAYEDAAAAAAAGSALAAGAHAAGDPAWAASLHVIAAELWARDAGDPARAQAAYERALATVPAYAPAVEGLCELHCRQGALDRAAALLEQHLAAQEAVERATAVLERLVELYADAGDLARALDAQARLLARDPEPARAVRYLGRMQAMLSALGRHADEVAVLVDLADRLTADPGRRATALYRAARLCEHTLCDAARAADLYGEVLKVWPGDRYARAARAALLRRAGRWDDLVAERRAEAAELEDGPALSRALREAALVLAGELGRSAEAALIYRVLLDRLPGDAGALRGLAELLEDMAAATGDAPAELVDVLEEEITADAPDSARAVAALRLALAHERAGRVDEALDAYRRAAELAPDSALATTALAELAAESGDEFAQIDALSQLAQGRTDPRLRGELIEEVAWLWAGAAEDLDRASSAFDEASRLDRSRPGPLLGKLLLQARQGDVPGAGQTLEALAGSIRAPGAAAAMLLRAAAIAEGEGDVERAHDRLYAALVQVPEDQGTLMVAAEYAALAGPEDRATTEQLEGRAELFALRARLAGSAASRVDWELSCAEALAGAGKLREAARLAAAVASARPGHLRALRLLGRVCRQGGDRDGLARASLALAGVLRDPGARCALLREAAAIFDAERGDSASAAPIYRRILADEPDAAEFERLAAICREHGDGRTLFEIISARLDWLASGVHDAGVRAHQVELLLERAALRRDAGDTRGQIADLAALLDVEPHSGAGLSAMAQAMLAAGDSRAAAELWGRYLAVESDPERRAAAELSLSQILAEDMDDVAGAIAQLDSVVAQTPGDVAVRERLIKLLARAGDWERACAEISALAEHRGGPAERARDELRVAEIAQTRLGDKARARAALERARQLDPLNTDAVRQLGELLAGDADARRRALHGAARDIHKAIARSPAEARLYERLAAIHGWLEERDGQYYALSAVQALGALPADRKPLLAGGAATLAAAPLPRAALSDEDWHRSLSAQPADSSAAVADVWSVIAEAVARLTGGEPGQLGFGRGDKIAAKALSRRFEALAAALDCMGLSGVELYVSESRPGYARVLSLSRPILCLGADVAAADSATARFLLGRAMAQARERTGSLTELGQRDVELLVAAAAQAAGLSTLPPVLARIVDGHGSEVAARGKELQKQLGRRDRRALGQVFERIAELGDPGAWHKAALATAARAGLLLCGDVSAALEALGEGTGGRALADSAVALDLLCWMVSREHLALRAQLGMGSPG